MCLTRLDSHIITTSHNLPTLICIRGYVAVGGGVMQLHGGCRFAPGASAARAEPLHVLVVSGRAAVPGHGERGTAVRAGGCTLDLV